MRDYDAIVLAGGLGQRLGGIDKAMLSVGGRPILAHVLAAAAGAGRRIVVGPTRGAGDVPRREDGPCRPDESCQGAWHQSAWWHDVVWCQEDPPHGGPRAALSAALPLVRAQTVLVLGGDLPAIGPAVPVLLDRLHRDRRAAVDVQSDCAAANSGRAAANAGAAADADADAGADTDADAGADTDADAGADVAVLADPDGQVNFVAAAWRTGALADALRRAPGVSLRALYSQVRVTLVADAAGWGADCDTLADLEAACRRALAESGTLNETADPRGRPAAGAGPANHPRPTQRPTTGRQHD